MGWSFMAKPEGVSAAGMIASEEFGISSFELIAIEEVPGAVFAAVKAPVPSGEWARCYAVPPGEPIVFAEVFLIEDKGLGKYGFGYKGMSEWMGPYHPGAASPEFMAKLSPLAAGKCGWAAEWRARQAAKSMAKMEG